MDLEAVWPGAKAPSWRQACGQLLWVGYEDQRPNKELADALSAGERGGVILFRRNVESAIQVAEDIAKMQSYRPAGMPPLLMGVDEEGGRVSRLKPFVLPLPPMLALGSAPLSWLKRAGEALGEDLAALGFNVDFSPVLDVHTNEANPVIGDRAFATTPEGVSERALAFAEGLSKHVLWCGKHFPGHGDTDLDSHLALPRIRHDRARLDAVELAPFRAAIAQKMPLLMSAHVVMDAFEPATPATLSRRVCHELLRQELGYQGVLVSDDLEMKAIAGDGSLGPSAVAAVRAGCDLFLVCRRWERQLELLDALEIECEKDPAFQELIVGSLKRILGLRAPLATPLTPAPADLEKRLNRPEKQALMSELAPAKVQS